MRMCLTSIPPAFCSSASKHLFIDLNTAYRVFRNSVHFTQNRLPEDET